MKRSRAARPLLLLTCEHGGNQIPEQYQGLFRSRGARRTLETHRGYDLGALHVARALARRFEVELVASEVSRLLVDLNRSLGHPRLFSEFTAPLDRAARRVVLEHHYSPHRSRVEHLVRERLRSGVLHIAVHSFTPELDGQVRTADVGLLYHPASPGERQTCERWQTLLKRLDPTLRVRRNYPYLGKSDAFPTYLRRRYGAASYQGIEIEINQARLVGSPALRDATLQSLSDSLAELLNFP